MLDDIRYTLEKARTTLSNGWTKGAFFEQKGDAEPDPDEFGYSVCLAGGVMAALDLVNEDEEELWKTPSARGAIEALYTHIPIRSKARREAEKQLLQHAGTAQHADPDQWVMNEMRQWRREYGLPGLPITPPNSNTYQAVYETFAEQVDLPDRNEGECKHCYNIMLGAITSWNDAESRRKKEVLDLVDKSIKGVIRKSEIVEP